MKAQHLPLFVLISSCVSAQDGVLDLTNPPNYAAQPVPNYIQKDNTPESNPITNRGASLGRVLFYDVRLSSNSTISCASCHQQENGFSDLNGGLMQNAIFTSLRQAIDHYDSIANPAPDNLDQRLGGGGGGPGGPSGGSQQLNLTEQEKTDLDNFLLTLSGPSVYPDEKWASPFDATGSLSLIVLPTAIANISVANAGEVTAMVTVSTQGVPQCFLSLLVFFRFS